MSTSSGNDRRCTRGHAFRGSDPCPVCWPGYRTFTVRAKVWIYPGTEACWHFLTIPKKESELLRERFAGVKRGWGSLPVAVRIGTTSWKTSVFPDKKADAYILPLKASVRKDESIRAGDTVEVRLEVRA